MKLARFRWLGLFVLPIALVACTACDHDMSDPTAHLAGLEQQFNFAAQVNRKSNADSNCAWRLGESDSAQRVYFDIRTD